MEDHYGQVIAAFVLFVCFVVPSLPGVLVTPSSPLPAPCPFYDRKIGDRKMEDHYGQVIAAFVLFVCFVVPSLPGVLVTPSSPLPAPCPFYDRKIGDRKMEDHYGQVIVGIRVIRVFRGSKPARCARYSLLSAPRSLPFLRQKNKGQKNGRPLRSSNSFVRGHLPVRVHRRGPRLVCRTASLARRAGADRARSGRTEVRPELCKTAL